MENAQKWVDLIGRALPQVVCLMILSAVVHHTYWHPDLALNKDVLGLAALAGGYLWGVNSKPTQPK